MKGQIVFIISILLNSCVLFGQGCIDTVKCDNNLIELKLPDTYKKNTISYEEGFSVTYLFCDSSFVFLNCGSMIDLPILKGELYELNCHQVSDSIIINKGLNKSGNYFREDNYKKHRIVILYDNVRKNKLELFNEFMNNIVIK